MKVSKDYEKTLLDSYLALVHARSLLNVFDSSFMDVSKALFATKALYIEAVNRSISGDNSRTKDGES